MKNLSARGWIDTIENIIVVSFEAILGGKNKQNINKNKRM